MNETVSAKNFFEKALINIQENNLNDAEKNLLKALKILPDRFSINFNLAIVYFKKKQFNQSINVFKKILKLNITNEELYDTYDLLSKAYENKKELLNSLIFKRKCLKLKTSKENFKETANLATRINFYYLSNIILSKAYKETKDKFFLIQKELNTKYIFKTNEENDRIRKNILKFISNCSNNNKESINLTTDNLINHPTFIHSYNNYNNRDFIKKIVIFLKKIYSINDDNLLKQKNLKKNIGFFSEFFTDHTIGKLFYGLISKLDKNYFNIKIFHTLRTKPGDLKTLFDLNFETHTLPQKHQEKIDFIKKFNLDIAFFPDIGMSTELYFLSLYKIATKQITSWGHPESTENSSVDYFLSSALLEKNYDSTLNHYSEKVLLPEHLPMFFFKPKISFKKKIFKKKLYCCSQTMIKMHPDFDEIIIKIIKKDPKSKILFIKDKDKILYKFFKNRLIKKDKNIIKNIYFINPLTGEDFIHLCGISSVLLDPLYFGSGNTFHESMFYGTPTISLPTEFMRSRIVLAAYKQMKIDYKKFIASDLDDYVNKAIYFANNPDENEKIKDKLRNAADKYLYENENAAKEIDILLKNL